MLSKVLVLAAAYIATVSGAAHELDCEGAEAMACVECIVCMVQTCLATKKPTRLARQSSQSVSCIYLYCDCNCKCIMYTRGCACNGRCVRVVCACWCVIYILTFFHFCFFLTNSCMQA